MRDAIDEPRGDVAAAFDRHDRQSQEAENRLVRAVDNAVADFRAGARAALAVAWRRHIGSTTEKVDPEDPRLDAVRADVERATAAALQALAVKLAALFDEAVETGDRLGRAHVETEIDVGRRRA